MKRTGKFVLFNPDEDDYLAGEAKGDDMNVLGWSRHPGEAIRFKSRGAAEARAHEIVGNNRCTLMICELYESDTQFQVKEVGKVVPVNPELN